MFAAVIDRNGGPEELRYTEVPEPSVRPGGLVVEVHAIGLQGGDLLNRRRGALVAQPHIVGYQASGVVREVGERVEGLAVGDRVVAMMMHGSHAELVSVNAARAWAIPPGLSFEEAAAVPVEFGTASDCLFEFGRLVAGETVLVHGGAGGVGLPAIQLAKAAGATVIATAGDDARVERLMGLGLDAGINYRTADVVAEVLRLTDGRGADLVVDPVGGSTLETSIASLAYRGRISWVGNASEIATGVEGRPEVWPLMAKNGSLSVLFFAAEMAHRTERVRALVSALLDRVAAAELSVVIDRVFPLSAAAEAHRCAEVEPQFGRIILVPDRHAR